MNITQSEEMMPEQYLTWVSRHAAPGIETHAPFPYEQIDRNLGAEPDPEPDDAEHMARLVQAIKAIFAFIIPPDIDARHANQYGRRYDQIAGRRALMLAWVIDPGFIPGSPSLTKLAKKIGVTAPILSAMSTEASATFGGIRNRAQRSFNKPKAKGTGAEAGDRKEGPINDL
jgi:hypothetical protein